MRKFVAFFAITIVLGAVAYTSMDWNGGKGKEVQTKQQVELAGGGTMELTGEESSLKAGPGEKEVVLTDLGMF